jgi:hypothetical protein
VKLFYLYLEDIKGGYSEVGGEVFGSAKELVDETSYPEDEVILDVLNSINILTDGIVFFSLNASNTEINSL